MVAHADEPAVEYRVTEPREVPGLSRVLGYGALLPLVIGAAAAWLLKGELATLALSLTILWAGSILVFLAGVRRGLSFRTVGGPTPVQIATVLWLFMLGLASAASPSSVAALVLLLVGFLSPGVLDPWAARRGEAPLFFARLRPFQILLPIASLAALLLLR